MLDAFWRDLNGTTKGTPPQPVHCHSLQAVRGYLYAFMGNNNDSSGSRKYSTRGEPTSGPCLWGYDKELLLGLNKTPAILKQEKCSFHLLFISTAFSF